MTNLEWLVKRDLITTNDVYGEMLDNMEQICINVLIKLRGCDYSDYKEKGIEWFLEEHKEPIKLKQWEKDLLEIIDYQETRFDFYNDLRNMKKRGYFEGITDTKMGIKEILENCEVEDR